MFYYTLAAIAGFVTLALLVWGFFEGPTQFRVGMTVVLMVGIVAPISAFLVWLSLNNWRLGY